MNATYCLLKKNQFLQQLSRKLFLLLLVLTAYPGCGKKKVIQKGLTGAYLFVITPKSLDYIEVSGFINESPVFQRRRFPENTGETLEPGEHSLAIILKEDDGGQILTLSVHGFAGGELVSNGLEDVILMSGRFVEVYMEMEKAPICGDGVIDEGEECDGNALGGETCESLGYDNGDLACGDDCIFDTSNCTGDGPECGNGVIEYREECDGNNLGGETCESLGYDGGVLTCDDDCNFDTKACVNCADGLTYCGGDCVDTQSDNNHCGECFNRCLGHTRVCTLGVCTAP